MTLNKFSVVFPGQGSQSPGMLADYFQNIPTFRDTFDEFSDFLELDLVKLISEGTKEELSQTEITQPLMLISDLAIWNLLRTSQKDLVCLAGHSLGEYAALVAAEVLSTKDAIKLVKKRAYLMQNAVPEGKGGIAAIIGLKKKSVINICKDISKNPNSLVNAANYNSETQIVISGTKKGVKKAIEFCKSAGAKRAVPLPMSVPAHSKLMLNASIEFSDYIQSIEFLYPKIPIIQNVDAKIEKDPDKIREKLIQQIHSPVKWLDSIYEMKEIGVNTIIECGPGKVLSGLIKRISSNIDSINTDNFENLATINNE
tara:strand:- start:3942 stop:4880 length:939 start_codon:yes stop_codon:yes gene_type:complete